MSGRPPPLTEEQKKARLARIQQDHDAFIRGIATMQSLPRLQSTIAGAGGKTNVVARMAQERDAQRMARLHKGLEESHRDEEARQETLAKAKQLEAVQSKKRQRRAAKKQRQKARTAQRSEEDSESDADSEDERALSAPPSAPATKTRRVEDEGGSSGPEDGDKDGEKP